MSDSEEVSSSGELFDFVCIDSHKFADYTDDSFTPAPTSTPAPSFTDLESTQRKDPEDNANDNNTEIEQGSPAKFPLLQDESEGLMDLRQAVLMKEPLVSTCVRQRNFKSLKGDHCNIMEYIVPQHPTRRFSFWKEVGFAVAYVVAVFSAGHFLTVRMTRKESSKPSMTNVSLLTWNQYNNTCPYPLRIEDYFFGDIEGSLPVSSTLLLPGPAKLRLLSTKTKVKRELLPSGKVRLLLEAYEPRLPAIPKDYPKPIKKTRNGFYVLCEGEQMICQCIRVAIMEMGKEPKYQRKCICEPLTEGDPSFDMTAPRTVREKMAMQKLGPTFLSAFVLAFNTYFRFSYFQLCKAGRVIKQVAFTLKCSTKLTFSKVKISFIKVYRKAEPQATSLFETASGQVFKTWTEIRGISKIAPKEAISLFGSAGGKAWTGIKDITKTTSKDAFTKCREGIYSVRDSAFKWTSEKLEPRLKEYWFWPKNRLEKA